MTQLYLVRRGMALTLVDESGDHVPGQVSVSANTAGGERATVTVTFLLRDGVGRGVYWSEPHTPAPQWADAPQWAQWRAQDKSGTWGWYEVSPQIPANSNEWDPLSELWAYAEEGDENPQWKSTLQKRPAAQD